MIDEVTRNRSFHQQTNMRAYGIGKFPPRSRKESGSFISFVCWLSGNSLSCLLRRINSFSKTPSFLDRPIRVKKTLWKIFVSQADKRELTLMMTFDSNDDFRPGYRYLLRNTLTRTIKPIYTITCHSQVQTIYYSAEDVCKCHTIVPGTWNIQVSLHFSDWNTTFNFFAVAELSRTNFDAQNMSSVMLPTAENLSVYEFSKAPTCKVELTQRSNVCAHANVIMIEWHVSGFQNQMILHEFQTTS